MSITITCGLKSKALEPPRSEARDRRGTSALGQLYLAPLSLLSNPMIATVAIKAGLRR